MVDKLFKDRGHSILTSAQGAPVAVPVLKQDFSASEVVDFVSACVFHVAHGDGRAEKVHLRASTGGADANVYVAVYPEAAVVHAAEGARVTSLPSVASSLRTPVPSHTVVSVMDGYQVGGGAVVVVFTDVAGPAVFGFTS